jgi:Ca-activated chloride channel homolog
MRAEPPEVMGTFQLGDPSALPLRSEELKLTIDGQHARTVVDRVFVNEAGGRVEGTFEFAVGERAKVTGFSYWNGKDRIVGEVLARGDAVEIYESTVTRNRDPGLLQEIRPGVFSFQVFPIDKRERKRVQIQYDQWLEQHDGVMVFRTPVRGHDTEIGIDLTDARGIVDLRSPTHDLRIEGRGEHLHATAVARGKTKELVLRWKLASPPLTLHGWVHKPKGEDAYVVMSVAAPRRDPAKRVPKDVTLVLDESGSMNGDAMENGKYAAAEIVRRLGAKDRVNVILFDDRTEPLFDAPRLLDDANRRDAIAFLDGAGHGGGTDIASALEAALERQNDDDRPKSILLITDGNSDREAAAAIVAQDKRDVRLFTVGIGPDTDKAGLTTLAQGKRGRFTHIEDANAISGALARIYDRIEAPAFVDLELDTHGGSLTRMYPETLPDLSLGDELVIAARVRGSGPLEVSLKGRTAHGVRTIVQKIDVAKTPKREWVGAMWARSRIDDLLVRLALEDADSAERIDEIVRLGMAYDIVTPYTAFLAIPEAELNERTRAMLERAREGSHHAESGRALASSSRDFAGVDFDEEMPISRERSSRRSARKSMADSAATERESGPGAGCARCDAAGGGPSTLAFLLGVGLALRRRRRA